MISIFANPASLGINGINGTYVKRVSSRIRGEEISAHMGTKYNPEKRDGVCIYIKPRWLRSVRDGDYVDILDEIDLVRKLKLRPGIKVVAMSQSQYDYLKEILPNEIFLIHHHHINFERYRRIRNEKLVGGMIGHTKLAYDIYENIKSNLAKKDIDFITIVDYKIRQDILDFFNKIDFLVVWNTHKPADYKYGHPTKIINAGSFGIPSMSQAIDAYKEFPYIPIKDMDSLVVEADKLKDVSDYQRWSDKVFQEAEKYHISRIAKLYKQLK